MKILVYKPSKKALLYYTNNHTGYTRETTTSWLQTKTLPVITIHSFQTNVTDVRCWKWFTETSQISIVSAQTQLFIPQLYVCVCIYIYIYIIQYYSSAGKHPKFSLPCLACTNITHTLSLCCALIRVWNFCFCCWTWEPVKQNHIWHWQSDQLPICCQYNIYVVVVDHFYMLILTSIVPEITS